MQVVSLLGRLGKDPEHKDLGNDKSVVNFSLACSEVWYKGSEKQEHTEWFRCVAWNKSAETIAKYVKSGDLFAVIGTLKTDSYDDKEGIKRYATNLTVHRFELQANKRDDSQGPPPVEDFDDDIPF